MSKSFSYPNKGTCSKETHIVLNDDHTIESIEVVGGCNGNLKGISRLLKGMKAEDAIARMRPPSHQLPRPDRPEPQARSGGAVKSGLRAGISLYKIAGSCPTAPPAIFDVALLDFVKSMCYTAFHLREESELSTWSLIPYPPAS